jgi:hypothetical protein
VAVARTPHHDDQRRGERGDGVTQPGGVSGGGCSYSASAQDYGGSGTRRTHLLHTPMTTTGIRRRRRRERDASYPSSPYADDEDDKEEWVSYDLRPRTDVSPPRCSFCRKASSRSTPAREAPGGWARLCLFCFPLPRRGSGTSRHRLSSKTDGLDRSDSTMGVLILALALRFSSEKIVRYRLEWIITLAVAVVAYASM